MIFMIATTADQLELNPLVKPIDKVGRLSLSKTKAEDSTAQSDPGVSLENDFATMLKGMLVPNSSNQINEEELFASIIRQRIQALKGEEGGTKYAEALQKHLDLMRRPDGYTYYEDCAKAALREMVEGGVLTTEEAEKIHAESFQGAQLDDNLEALYDGRGGPGDNTIAVADMEQALLLAAAKIGKFEAGEEDPGVLDLNHPSNTKSGAPAVGTAAGSAAGFLFKPESDKDGKLVILAPSALTGLIESVFLKDVNGELIEEGQYSDIGNGDREHFRFTKSGGEYPKDLVVEILKKDGTKEIIKISDPSERVEQ